MTTYEKAINAKRNRDDRKAHIRRQRELDRLVDATRMPPGVRRVMRG